MGPAPLQCALVSGELELLPQAGGSATSFGVQVPAVQAISLCRQSGAPSQRAHCLGCSRGAVSGQGAIGGSLSRFLGCWLSSCKVGSVCGHGHVFWVWLSFVLVSVIRFLSILWFSLFLSFYPHLLGSLTPSLPLSVLVSCLSSQGLCLSFIPSPISPYPPFLALYFKEYLCFYLPLFTSLPNPPTLDLDSETRHPLFHLLLQALVLPTPRSYVRADGAVAPDHWLEPSTVWEVRCADLSLSPIYPAARGLVSDAPRVDPPKEFQTGEWGGHADACPFWG